jgi:hypothetical protein
MGDLLDTLARLDDRLGLRLEQSPESPAQRILRTPSPLPKLVFVGASAVGVSCLLYMLASVLAGIPSRSTFVSAATLLTASALVIVVQSLAAGRDGG